MNLPGDYIKLNSPSRSCEGYNYECNEIALYKLQGETDSFGAEYFYYCQSCLDKTLLAVREYEDQEEYCEWCKKLAKLKPVRDFEEGFHGPVYYVCSSCRRAQRNDYHG